MSSRRRAALSLPAVLALAAGATVAAPSVSARSKSKPASRYSVSIQAVFDREGNPLLVANFSPNGALAAPRWSICPPASKGTCRPARTGQLLEPGPEPAGTRFLATARYAGRTYRASVVWRGQVHATSAPGLLGLIREGDIVTPVPAEWTGGWGGEQDQLGVEACATRGGARCRMLGGGELGCPDETSRPRLEGWFTGSDLFAVDARFARDVACAGTGYSTNADLPLWPLGATVVRSRALGRVTGSPRPSVRFLKAAELHNGTLYVARVHCPVRCTAALDVMTTTVEASRRYSFRGSRRLGVNAAGLMHGAMTVVLHVDDGPGLRANSAFPSAPPGPG